MAEIPMLHPAAVGLSVIRGLRNGSMRQYTSVEFTRGWPGVDHFLRQLRACGYVRPSGVGPSYAVLDVLDVDEDIVQDYDIPTAAAFRYVKRKLKLRVVDVDAELAKIGRSRASESEQNTGGTR